MAAVLQILPGRKDDSVSATLSTPRPHPERSGRSEAARTGAGTAAGAAASEANAYADRNEVPVPALWLLDTQKATVDKEAGRISERELKADAGVP